MKPYSIFADYYDTLMKDVDYGARTEYLCRIFKEHDLKGKSVLDLACGTGNMTFELVKRGYDVIGIDASEQMLSKAAKKNTYSIENPLFICQDMRRLDLYGTVSAAVCVLDGINHLTSLGDIRSAFSSVSLFLEKNGLFVFDLNTPYKFEKILGGNSFAYDYDDIFCVWQNYYSRRSRICHFNLTFFNRSGDLYKRYDESFSERAYTLSQIEKNLDASGLSLESCYDDMQFCRPGAESERIICVARKK